VPVGGVVDFQDGMAGEAVSGVGIEADRQRVNPEAYRSCGVNERRRYEPVSASGAT
jgi:hypothetical protein